MNYLEWQSQNKYRYICIVEKTVTYPGYVLWASWPNEMKYCSTLEEFLKEN